MLEKTLDILIRWRTYFANLALALMIVLPDILNAPEVLAVVPEQYQKYVLAAAVLVNIWLRPRPATRATDTEVKVAAAVKENTAASTITIKSGGETTAVIKSAAPPK